MVSILDLFIKKNLLVGFKQKGDGSYVGSCPSCGKKDNYSGFVIFPDSNTCYCHGSKTIFNFTETMYLLSGEITCREGRQKI